MSAEIADELRACAARIDADGTASQIVSADELRALAAMAEADGWQPIETAPKDGEAVLLYKPDERRVGEYIIAGYFGEWPGDGECWIACAGKPLGYFSEWQQAPQGYPTHWQPLPAPPSRPNKEDRNG